MAASSTPARRKGEATTLWDRFLRRDRDDDLQEEIQAHLAGAVQDLRYAGRTLGRTPGYALVVVAVLSLGIAANVAATVTLASLVPAWGASRTDPISALRYR